MKNIRKIKYEPLLIIVIFIISSFQMTFGQFHNSPSLTESSVFGTSTVNARCTGNDVYDDVSNNDTYRVSVWDDNSSSGIYWEVDYNGTPYSNNASFVYNVDDPDVVLVYDGTDFYAIVVYHVGGMTNAWYYEPFKWTNSSGNWAFTSIGASWIANGNYGTSINIDGNDVGDFVITYDTSTPTIMLAGGNANSGTISLNTPFSAATGSMSPDVALFHDGAGNDVAHLTYINSAATTLRVATYALSDINSGNNSYSSIISPSSASGFLFNIPRIACPNSSVGSSSNWHVVVQHYKSTSQWDIIGFNDNSGSTPKLYNDGISPSPHSIELCNNFLPVVTYDDQNNIWVGWSWDNTTCGITTGSPYAAIYPIVLQCDNTGTITGSQYWQVPNGMSTNDFIDVLSLSGKYASDRLFLTYNPITLGGSTINDIYNKEKTPSSGTAGLKLFEHQNDFLELGDPESNIIAYIYDQMGRLVFTYEGRSGNLTDEIEKVERNPGSIKILKVMNSKGELLFIKKVFLK